MTTEAIDCHQLLEVDQSTLTELKKLVQFHRAYHKQAWVIEADGLRRVDKLNRLLNDNKVHLFVAWRGQSRQVAGLVAVFVAKDNQGSTFKIDRPLTYESDGLELELYSVAISQIKQIVRQSLIAD